MANKRDSSALISGSSPVGVPMANIAGIVSKARISQGWTQKELAGRADVSRPSIARIEGGHDVNTNVLNKVLGALGLALDIRDDR